MIATKNKLRNLTTILLVVIMFLVLTSMVSAWGVAPSRQYVKNTQNTQTIKVSLINNDLETGYFKVRFGGDLAKYASYDGDLVYLFEEDPSVDISFKLNLPSNLDPGKNVLTVILEQVGSESSNTVGATVTLIAEVIVSIPYDGQFLTTKLTAHPSFANEPTPFTISLFNTGTTDLNVRAELEIRGPANNLLATLNADTKYLEMGKADKFELYWSGEKYPGDYLVQVTVYYGDSFKVLKSPFVISGEKVVSTGISSDNFDLGKVVPVNILAKSNWNLDLKGIFAEVFVLTPTGNLVQSFKSGPESIPSRESKELLAYWDTAKLVVGNYNLNVVLHYDGGTSQEMYPASVTMNKLIVTNTATGQVTGAGSSNGSNTNLLVLLVLILIVINVTGIIFIKKYFTKKKGK